MPNAIDRLFEQVLSRLPDLGADEDTAWPDLFDETHDALDRPPNLEGIEISPYDEKIELDRALDRLTRGMTVPELSDDEKGLVEGGLRARGIEAIAFYKSKRFIDRDPFIGQWGIFYIREGIWHISWLIQQEYPGYADPRPLAHKFLRAHEHFHFRADVQTLMLEATLGRHLYIPNRQRFARARTAFVEEAIANRQAYDWARSHAIGLEEFAANFMLCQPNAYARFREPIADLTGEWMANLVDAQPPRCPPRYDLAPWVTNTPRDFLRKSLCPEWVISPNKLSDWIDPALITPPVKAISETDELLKKLNKRLRTLQSAWQKTKEKLVANKDMHGLNFKPWSKDGPKRYSVRVDRGNRAHLENLGDGRWLAYAIGSHAELGHD